MSSTHRGHTATLLADERILVVGGTSANTQLATADIYDPAVNNWTAAPNMSLARNGHTATLMKNGKVLVAGGQNYNEQAGYAKSCEIFDPQSDTWSAASNMADRRGYHRDVLLPNGDVMVISGYWVGTCERYNPANNTWSTTARMASSRFNFTANVLTDGKVVLTGGYDGGGAMASVEEYDPMQNSWLALPRLITGRSSHASVVLNDGKLMVIGGHGQNYLATAEHLVPPPLPQTITFNSIPNQTFGAAPINLSATASSGLPCSFTVVSGNATISSNTLTITGAGLITVEASQSGSQQWLAAPVKAQSFYVEKADAAPSLSNLSHTYNGAPHAAVATTTPLGQPVTLTYNGSTVAPSEPGSYTVLAAVNTANYKGTASAILTIEKKVAAVFVSTQAHLYDGLAHAAQIFTVPDGLTLQLKYNGSSAPPTEPGVYTINATVDDPHYTGSAVGLLTIDKIPTTFELFELAQTYDGLPKSARVVTQPAGVTINVRYNGSATPPTNAGTYLLSASVSDSYHSGSVSAQLTINPAPGTVTVSSETIIADGSPKSVSIITVPEGLKVSVSYNGVTSPPAEPGRYNVSVNIADPNYFGVGTGVLTIKLANRSPQIFSEASPSQGTVPLQVAFTATANDPDGDALTQQWDFGDGSPVSTSLGESHTFYAPGIYTAKLSVIDVHGLSAVSFHTVTVKAAGVGTIGEVDSDGDGFSNALENAFNSNSSSAADTPFGMPGPKSIRALAVSKLQIRLNFKVAGKDALTLEGTLPIDEGFQPAGQRMLIDIGGLARSFELDAQGATVAEAANFVLKLKLKKGKVPLQAAKMTLSIKNDRLGETLAAYGLENKSLRRRVTIPVSLFFGETVFQRNIELPYAAIKDLRGSAK